MGYYLFGALRELKFHEAPTEIAIFQGFSRPWQCFSHYHETSGCSIRRAYLSKTGIFVRSFTFSADVRIAKVSGETNEGCAKVLYGLSLNVSVHQYHFCIEASGFFVH